MYKIALVGLLYDDNLGDPMMVECVEKLYNKIALKKSLSIDFNYVDLYGREDQYNKFKHNNKKNYITFPYRIAKKITKKSSEKTYLYFERELYKKDSNQEKRIEEYYYKKLQDIDLIVVVGGALIKYRYSRDFHNPLSTLIKIAEKLNIMVTFNSVGIESGYDESYNTCKLVKKFLNSENVKQITTRDDFTTLKKYVFNQQTIIEKTADSAVWYKELFNVKELNTEKVLGIGVISPEKYNQYSEDNRSQSYIKLIYDFVNLLVEKKVKFRLFTNGHDMDQVFLEEIAKNLNLDNSYICKRPAHYSEIVENMNSFHTIVASRLHACILGYSLDLPVIGLDWNGKLKFFGKAINYPERFLIPSEISSDELFDLTKNIGGKRYEPSFRKTYRETQIKSIERTFDFISK